MIAIRSRYSILQCMVAKKSSTTKKKTTVAKTAPVRKRSSKKSTKRASQLKSFRLSKSETPFMTFNPNVQSLYWVILGAVAIAFTMWIMQLQADLQAAYDQIDLNTSLIDENASNLEQLSQPKTE